MKARLKMSQLTKIIKKKQERYTGGISKYKSELESLFNCTVWIDFWPNSTSPKNNSDDDSRTAAPMALPVTWTCVEFPPGVVKSKKSEEKVPLVNGLYTHLNLTT